MTDKARRIILDALDNDWAIRPQEKQETAQKFLKSVKRTAKMLRVLIPQVDELEFELLTPTCVIVYRLPEFVKVFHPDH